MRIPTDLRGIRDTIPFLQIFNHKVRTVVLAASHKPIHKRSVEQYIHSVVKIFVAVGSPDPRLNNMGAIDFCLGRQLATYEKEDPDPGRVCPLPVSILHCMDSASNSGSPRDKAIADLAWIAFFFLLQPGEYCAGGTDTVSTPFNLRDIQFFVGDQPTQATTASATTCADVTFVSLLFTAQNNGVKGESIGHGATGHPCTCAVAAIRSRVAHLRQHGATPDTHLAAVFNGLKWSTVYSAKITAALRAATTIIGP